MTALLHAPNHGTWSVDAGASSARFIARDVLRKPVVGTLPVLAASVEVSASGVPVRISADLDLNGVDTGSPRRDRDLRGPRFFAVQQGGVLRFSATVARADGAGRWLLDGEIVLRGVRCPLPVQVEITDVSDERVAVLARAVLDRREIGIDVPRLLVGRVVTISVDAVLTPPNPAGLRQADGRSRPRSARP